MLKRWFGCAKFCGSFGIRKVVSRWRRRMGGIVAFAQGIYWLLLGYSYSVLSVPLVRYFD